MAYIRGAQCVVFFFKEKMKNSPPEKMASVVTNRKLSIVSVSSFSLADSACMFLMSGKGAHLQKFHSGKARL